MHLLRLSRALGLLVLACALSLSVATPASALYCSRRIVSEGDGTSQVRALCGDPVSVATRSETRSQLVRGRGGVVLGVYSITVEIEVWLYDFGSNRLMVELVFVDGTLERERTLGYGTGEGRARR